ncbi:hypothetical protein AAHC03_09362 [Spirometra sp. Aus1]
MDFSVAQFTAGSIIPDTSSSPLPLVKHDYTVSAEQSQSTSYSDVSDASSIFHSVTSFADTKGPYNNSLPSCGPEDFSRTCFPYTGLDSTSETTSTPEGVQFLPFDGVGPADREPEKADGICTDSPTQDETSNSTHNSLIPDRLTNDTGQTASSYETGEAPVYGGYYFGEHLDFSVESRSRIRGNEASDANYRYATLTDFKNMAPNALGGSLDPTVQNWTSCSEAVTSHSNPVHSADLSSSTSHSYPVDQEQLLDCSNRGGNKGFDGCGDSDDFSAAEQAIFLDQEFNGTPYLPPNQTHSMNTQCMESQNYPNPTYNQGNFPTIFSYPNISADSKFGFVNSNQNPRPDVNSPSFLLNAGDPNNLNICSRNMEMVGTPDSCEPHNCSPEKHLYTHPNQSSLAASHSWSGELGIPKDVMMSALAQTRGGVKMPTIPDKDELNTKELAQRVSAELKRYSIPQAVFAQRVLCRSQGTLSDLLRNPKPWSKLKSGRETFRRMWKWLQEPECQRMSALRLAGKYLQKKTKEPEIVCTDEIRSCKRPRLVFTDIQRRTLHAIFKETKRPSKEMQTTIAQQLGLEISTVANFFMNARRRSSEKWQDGDSKNSSLADSSSPRSSTSQQDGMQMLQSKHPRDTIDEFSNEASLLVAGGHTAAASGASILNLKTGSGATGVPPFPTYSNPSDAAAAAAAAAGDGGYSNLGISFAGDSDPRTAAETPLSNISYGQCMQAAQAAGLNVQPAFMPSLMESRQQFAHNGQPAGGSSNGVGNAPVCPHPAGGSSAFSPHMYTGGTSGLRNPLHNQLTSLTQQNFIQKRLFPYVRTTASHYQNPAHYSSSSAAGMPSGAGLPAQVPSAFEDPAAAAAAAANFGLLSFPPGAASRSFRNHGSLFDLQRLASASQIDPRFLATATELSAGHQSLRDQALEICSSMTAAGYVGFQRASNERDGHAAHPSGTVNSNNLNTSVCAKKEKLRAEPTTEAEPPVEVTLTTKLEDSLERDQ